MKRNLIYWVFVLGLSTIMSACFEDKSSEADHIIPEIEIDTVGIGAELEVLRYGQLKISPSVQKVGTDPSAFTYKWMLSLEPISPVSTPEYFCIGTEMTLDTQIEFDSNSDPYRLWYQVTDNTTGLRKDIVWELTIKAPYNEGLIIAESFDNGQTTDLAFLEGKDFTVGYEGEPKTYHELYSAANGGQKIQGRVKQMVAYKQQHQSLPYSKFFGIISEGEDKYLHLNKNYEVVYRNEEGFMDGAIDVLNPTHLSIFNSRYLSIINNGSMHTVDYNGTQLIQFSLANITTVIGGTTDTPVYDKYAAHGINTSWYYPYLFYDNVRGAFCTISGYPSVSNTLVFLSSSKDFGNFNPSSCPGLETVFGSFGYSNQLFMIMKKSETGSYLIYSCNKSGSPAQYHELPVGCGVEDAVGFVASQLGNVIYFATKYDLYAIVMDAEPLQVNKVHSFSDEITHFTVLRQAACTTNYYSQSLETHENLLMVATWNGSSGSLNTVPIESPNTGDLAVGEVKEYSGFGKILYVTHQEE